MNIAFFLTPKSNVAYLYEDFTIRQGLEKLRHHGYSAIPVLSRDNKYVSTVSEGDFLWNLLKNVQGQQEELALHNIKNLSIRDIIDSHKNPPVRITADMEDLLARALKQSFVPVIDDNDAFIGIVTRKAILQYLYEASQQVTPPK